MNQCDTETFSNATKHCEMIEEADNQHHYLVFVDKSGREIGYIELHYEMGEIRETYHLWEYGI